MSVTIDGLVAVDQKMGAALKKLEEEVTDIETQREGVRTAIMGRGLSRCVQRMVQLLGQLKIDTGRVIGLHCINIF
jgi:hypothetical protein